MPKDGNKKSTIPKHLAGIKVPKKLRKAGNKAIKLAGDPLVSEVVAAALLSAAAALREGGKAKPKGAKSGAAAAAGGGKSASDEGGNANFLGDSLKVLAVDFARRTLEGVEDANRARARRRADSPETEGSDA